VLPVQATAHTDHWQLGEPDLTRQVPPTQVDSGRGDFVQRSVIDLGLTAPRLLRSLEYMPGDRRVVRAATFFVEGTGQWLGSWTPWYGFTKQPEGAAAGLPARSRIMAEIHYRGSNEPVTDSGSLGLFFDDSRTNAARSTVAPRPALSSDLVLDAVFAATATPTTRRADGATRVLRATTRLTADTHVWALRPDVVPGLASIEVAARTPNGATEILLLARDPSAEWPTPYILKTPRLLRRGTVLRVVAHTRAASRAEGTNHVRLTISQY
jgi:hypothetical protein